MLTSNVTGLGAMRVFEAVKEYCPNSKIYQASSSEMFGNSSGIKNELTRLYPESPYGIAKVFAHKSAQHYRKAYDLFISCGILFNHESPLRGLEFVTRKITYNISRIKTMKKSKFSLGNINAKRDWGYAPEYVQAMWMMLQKDEPSEYVISTGESHSVEEFLTDAFDYAGLGDWHSYVDIDDQHYLRPSDIDELLGDNTKSMKELGWKPDVKYKELVKIMVDADLDSTFKN
jgi:GDPmannose 4,6-dehydratase